MKPKDYALTQTCATCGFAFIKKEYEDGDQYFCTLNDKKPRPKCGSVFMNERFNFTGGKWGGCPELTKWDNWAKSREVSAWGQCPAYKKC